MDDVKRFIVGIFSMIILMIYSGMTISTFWGWFIVPLGVRDINTPWAIGITCLFGIMKGESVSFREEDSFFWKIMKPFTYVTFINIVGFVAHFFM